jgi:chromosome segregation ATPase
MNRNKLKILLAAALGSIAGCAATPETCDPDRGGFLQSTGCLATGSYEQRERTLNSELEREREINRAFRKLQVSIDWEKRQAEARLASTQSEYEALDQAWQALRRQLDERGRRNQILAKQVRDMDTNIAKMKRPSNPPQEKEKQLNDLRRQATLLQQELEAGIYD